jgi:hypothetical protein
MGHLWGLGGYSMPAVGILLQSATNLVPSTWGSIVQAYLLAHAP